MSKTSSKVVEAISVFYSNIVPQVGDKGHEIFSKPMFHHRRIGTGFQIYDLVLIFFFYSWGESLFTLSCLMLEKMGHSELFPFCFIQFIFLLLYYNLSLRSLNLPLMLVVQGLLNSTYWIRETR